MILINFKIYKETFGDSAVELAKIVKEVGDKFKVRTVVTASPLDAVRLIRETGVEVWLQNVDEFIDGKHTGWISAQQAWELGIKGSLLNHSEHKIPKGKISKILKQKPKGFEIMCCVTGPGQVAAWTNKVKPEWILYEPPELIASTKTSVARAEPELIKRAVEAAGATPVLVGAGVKDKNDAEVSIKLGAKGVGLASAFVLGTDPRKILEDIAQGFNFP